MRKYFLKSVLLLVACLISLPLWAQGTPKPFAGQHLTIATKEAPPFAIKKDDGSWTGISIELWRQIADDMEVTYSLVETDLGGMIEGLKEGKYDAGVAALTITEQREEVLDFSHPFYTAGLGIAIPYDVSMSWWGVAINLFSPAFLKALSTLIGLLLVSGIMLWLVERRKNPEHFGGTPLQGIGSGFWHSSVVVTTLGFGDKFAVTFLGRALSLVLVFTGLICISGLTGSVASSLMASRLESDIQGPKDLPRHRVASVSSSASAEWLDNAHISFAEHSGPEAAMAAVVDKRQAAVVYDAPILRYLIHKNYTGELHVLPGTFDRQDYGIGLPQGSPLRETINRTLLKKIGRQGWSHLVQTYLGQE